MSTRYSYFALVTSTYPSADEPSIVCRQWTDEDGRTHEEKYTENLKWEKSCVSYYVQSGKQDGEIHEIAEEAALRFVGETQPARVHGLRPADGQYFYSVIVTNLHPLENPRALLRTWLSPQGYSMEQEWTPTGGWMNSNYMYDLNYDHLDGEAVGIAEEDVQRYQDIAEKNYRAATRVIDYRYYAIVAEGHPADDPLTMVRQWDEDDEVKEQQMDEDLMWVPSDLVRQHGDQAVPVDADAAKKLEFTLVKRYRKRHEL